MKKKLLAILIATTMSMTLSACGGGEEPTTNEAVVNADTTSNDTASNDDTDTTADDVNAIDVADEDVSGEFTEEQAALAQEYLDMCVAYDEAVNLVNDTPELLEQQELVDVMNELTAAIDEADELFADPANLTPEVMDGLRTAFDQVYTFVDEVNTLVESIDTDANTEASEIDELASVLTIGYGGADEAENTYYFVCDDEVTFASLVILSADMTQNVYCIGEVVDNGDGTMTINDEEGYTITFAVEEAEGGVILTLEDGTTVGMAAWDPAEIIEMMLTIDAETENVNQ